MSYLTISEMSQDFYIQQRIQACQAQEGTQHELLVICAAPGWSEAWESAVAGGIENPGKDEAVITDSMILSSVQAQPPADPDA